jgi:hypothetical protein
LLWRRACLRTADAGFRRLELGRLDIVDHRIQVLVGSAETLEGTDERVAALGREHLRPASRELDARNGVVATANANPLATTLAIVTSVRAIVAVALIPVHMLLNCSRYAPLKCGIAFSWNSELPSGRNPFWIRDDALAGLGLHAGDAVAIDTRAEPRDGDLVVVEVDVDGDSQRLARRYFSTADEVRLEAVGGADDPLILERDSVLVLGVIAARVRFSQGADQPVEEPL